MEPRKSLRVIENTPDTAHIRRAYDLFSYFYGWLIGPLERTPRILGLERADIQPRDRVLEVGFGPGRTLLEIARKAHPALVCGVDLSPKMLAVARRRLEKAGCSNVELGLADARALPLPGGAFDVLYSSYVLDLLPWRDMPSVLREFLRVLKPGGRLVLVSLSRNSNRRTLLEALYVLLPKSWAAYLLGGCRPVFLEGLAREAGFHEVQRKMIRRVFFSEIVTARKPAA